MPRPTRRLSDTEFNQLRARFGAPDENYNLLNSMHPVFGRTRVWDGDYTREQYLRSVDHLIGVLDGSITKREVQTEGQTEWAAPDVVVWLDKSARPAAWFVDAFWNQMASPGRSKPRYEFVRIDRRDWLIHMGYTDTQSRDATRKTVRVEAVPEEQILRIRALFSAEPVDPNRWCEQMAAAATTLDGRDVLIVDETMVSGATLRIATGLIGRVAPSARVSGTYFWRDTTSKPVNGISQPATVPIWYPGERTDGSEVTVFGRGVGNSSSAYWEHQPNSEEVIRKRIAAAVVSAPHHDPQTFEHQEDELADMLVQDIAYLTYDYAAGRVLRRPSHLRPDDDFDLIVAEQGLSFDDFVAFNDRRAEEIRRRLG